MADRGFEMWCSDRCKQYGRFDQNKIQRPRKQAIEIEIIKHFEKVYTREIVTKNLKQIKTFAIQRRTPIIMAPHKNTCKSFRSPGMILEGLRKQDLEKKIHGRRDA